MRAGIKLAPHARRHRRPRQGRLARRAAALAAPRGRRPAEPSRPAVGAPRAGRTSSAPSAFAAPSATRCSSSATSRSSWTARSARRRRGCWTAPASRSRAASDSPRSSGTAPRPASRSPSTRSATARTARRSTPSRRHASVWQPLGLRHRIEHAQCLAPEDLPRFAALGVACSVQFSHAPSDRDLADRFWAGKTDGAYAFRSLWESGALVANGSDAPIEELDPLAGIRAGVRRTIDERAAWHPEQAVTVEQALQATTVNPAWLAGDEHRRGKLVARLPRRSRRARPRPGRGPRRAGRRDDGRRALGAQPAALGLSSHPERSPGARRPGFVRKSPEWPPRRRSSRLARSSP